MADTTTPYNKRKTSVRGADNKTSSTKRYYTLREGVGQVKGAQEPSPLTSFKYGRILKGTRTVEVSGDDTTAIRALGRHGSFTESDPPKQSEIKE